MNDGLSVEFKVHLGNGRAGHRRMREADGPSWQEDIGESGNDAPYIARMVTLAHHFDEMIQRGEVSDYAEIARLAGVTRAWVTHIISLLFLAPDIQQDLLFAAMASAGRIISHRKLRRIAAEFDWSIQRQMYRRS